MKKIIACTLAVLAVVAVFGQHPSDSVKVYFGINRALFDPARGNNASSMKQFVEKVRAAADADDLDHIVIYGYASPDGPISFNERLAQKRCEAIAAYLVKQTGIGREFIQTRPGGVAWDELRRLVADSRSVPSREQILEILDTTTLTNPRGGEFDRKRQLQLLAHGAPYRWMLSHFFPQLRHALAVFLYLKSDRCEQLTIADPVDPVLEAGAADTPATAAGADAVPAAAPETPETPTAPEALEPAVTPETPRSAAGDEPSVADTAAPSQPAQPSQEAQKKAGPAAIPPLHRFALKTNVLYYGALMPNLELEWLFNDRWSASVEGNIAWWSNDSRHKSYDLAIIDSEVRRWIKPRAPWHGMYTGFFAGGGWYDLENGGLGYYGEGFMTGLSFGYMWPISRNFSLEAGLGLGYVYTRFKEYIPFEGHYLYQRTKSLNYFGPVKLKFSIAWRFSDRNRSKQKKSGGDE